MSEKGRVELLQVSRSVRGAGEVRAMRELLVHREYASALKVFPQDLGSLLLV